MQGSDDLDFVDVPLELAMDVLRAAQMVVMNQTDYDAMCATCPSSSSSSSPSSPSSPSSSAAAEASAGIMNSDATAVARAILFLLVFVFSVRLWRSVTGVLGGS